MQFSSVSKIICSLSHDKTSLHDRHFNRQKVTLLLQIQIYTLDISSLHLYRGTVLGDAIVSCSNV